MDDFRHIEADVSSIVNLFVRAAALKQIPNSAEMTAIPISKVWCYITIRNFTHGGASSRTPGGVNNGRPLVVSTVGGARYRFDVDGLRAVAIVPVVLYHAGVEAFSGGYVGVDVFFVISGYLISVILIKETSEGRFSIGRFYERRIRRIAPALFVVTLFCLFAEWTLTTPDVFHEFGRSLTSVALFVSNIFFYTTAEPQGYFADETNKRILLHTWSLAVEEQFYILFPAIIYALQRSPSCVRGPVLLFLGCLSFAVGAVTLRTQPTAAFYLLGSRAWELLLGALLAVDLLPPLSIRAVRETGAFVGLTLIAFAVFMFTKETPFPGPNALAPCLGAWLILYSGSHGPTIVGRILSIRALTFIGLLSYSLYLWHWPLIKITEAVIVRPLTAPETTAVVLVAVILAYVSYRYVERPFRGNTPILSRRQIFYSGVVATGTMVFCGMAIVERQGFSGRFDQRRLQTISANMTIKSDFGAMSDCLNFRKVVNTLADIAYCPLRHGEPTNILFWGDSHVEQYHPLIDELYKEGALKGRGALFAIAAGCVPSQTAYGDGVNPLCERFATLALERATLRDVDTVFFGFAALFTRSDGTTCLGKPGPRGVEMQRRFIAELGKNVRSMIVAGKRVIVALPTPTYDRDIPDMAIRNVILGSAFGVDIPVRCDYASFRAEILETLKGLNVTVFDPRGDLCHGDDCTYAAKGVSIYRDDNHIAASHSTLFRDSLSRALKEALSKAL